jgi:hypothetical protein
MKLPSLSQRFGFVGLIVVLVLLGTTAARSQSSYEFNDSHFHLTNNIQDGPDIHDFLNMMGSKAGRVALSGIPLQQQWSYRVDGSRAPTYYLHSDAPLYYYSFTDARIAMAYKSLPKEQQEHFDPMITGLAQPTCTLQITSGAYCRRFRVCSPASASLQSTKSLWPRRYRVQWPAWKTRHSIASLNLPPRPAL